MFDSHKDLTINRLLEVPDNENIRLTSDVIKDRLEADRSDTFFDEEYLAEIRREVLQARLAEARDRPAEGEDLKAGRPIRPRGFLYWVLQLMGWKDVPLAPALQDVVDDSQEFAEVRTRGLGLAMQEIQEVIDQQIRERTRSIQPDQEESADESGTVRAGARQALLKIRRSFLRAAYTIGLDIGTDSIKFVQLKNQSGSVVLETYGMRRIPPEVRDSPGDRAERIRKDLLAMLPEEMLAVSDVHVVLSDLPRDIRVEALPRVEAAELEELIRYKVEQVIPNAAEERYIRYEVLGETEERGTEKVRVLIASTPKTAVQEALELLSNAGIEPIKITLPALAASDSFQTFQSADETSGGTLVLDIGTKRTSMMFHNHGSLQVIRDAPIGSEDFTVALAGVYTAGDQRVEVDLEQAEAYKQRYGVPLVDDTTEVVPGLTVQDLAEKGRPTMERFLGEVSRSIDYYRSLNPDATLQHVYLIGGGALLPHLEELLTNALGLPVRPMKVFHHLSVGEKIVDGKLLASDSHRLVSAIGAALDLDDALNFMPSNMRHQRVQRLSWASLTVASIFLFLLLAFLSWQQFANQAELEETLSATQYRYDNLGEAQRQVLQLTQAREQLTATQQQVATQIQSLGGQRSTVALLQLVSQLIPGYVRLDQLEYLDTDAGGPKIRLAGVARDPDHAQDQVYDFLVRLERAAIFREVVLVQNVSVDDDQGFIIECELENP